MDVNYILNGGSKKQDALSPSYILNGYVKQKAKKTKMTNMSNRDFWKMNAVGSGKSWMDSDRDGVVNGIDCYPYDANRHGFFAKAYNLARGKGFKEHTEVAYNEAVERTNVAEAKLREEHKLVDRLNDSRREVSLNAKIKRAERIKEAQQERHNLAMKEGEARDADRKWKYENSSEYKKKMREQKESEDTFERMQAQAEYEKERKESKGLFGNVVRNVGEDVGTGLGVIKRNVQRKFGYVTVAPTKREEMQAEDFNNYRAGLIATGVDPKKVRAVSEKIAGTEEYEMRKQELINKGVDTAEKRYNDRLGRLRGMLNSKYGKDNKTNMEKKQKEFAAEEAKLKAAFDAEKNLAVINTEEMLKKTSITPGGAKNLFKDELQEINLAKASKEVQAKQIIAESRYADVRRLTSEANYADLRGRMGSQRPINFGAIAGGQRGMGSDIFSQMRNPYQTDIFAETRNQYNQNNNLFGEVKQQQGNLTQSLLGEVRNTVQQGNELQSVRDVVQEPPKPIFASIPGLLGTQEQLSRPYDANKPRFMYVKKIGNLTRKTDRVRAGDELQVGQASVPSFEKREGAQYPWTKPMMGWERVYQGSGAYSGKGRKPASMGNYNEIRPKFGSKTMKYHPPKRKFTPFVRTYGEKWTNYL